MAWETLKQENGTYLLCPSVMVILMSLCRQAYMDFITFFGLIGTLIMSFLFSYDIVCQWSRKLPTRMQQLPECMRLSAQQLKNSTFVVPKLHLWGHGMKCQVKYSLNLLRWSARTDGEGIERFWAFLNPLSMSTREMGAGSRQDTIDDHVRWWNWRKIVGFCESRLCKCLYTFPNVFARVVSCYTTR